MAENGGWLAKEMREVEQEIRRWPAWMREAARFEERPRGEKQSRESKAGQYARLDAPESPKSR